MLSLCGRVTLIIVLLWEGHDSVPVTELPTELLTATLHTSQLLISPSHEVTRVLSEENDSEEPLSSFSRDNNALYGAGIDQPHHPDINDTNPISTTSTTTAIEEAAETSVTTLPPSFKEEYSETKVETTTLLTETLSPNIDEYSDPQPLDSTVELQEETDSSLLTTFPTTYIQPFSLEKENDEKEVIETTTPAVVPASTTTVQPWSSSKDAVQTRDPFSSSSKDNDAVHTLNPSSISLKDAVQNLDQTWRSSKDAVNKNPAPSTKDPLLYSYQNDPHWDLGADFPDYDLGEEEEKEKAKEDDILHKKDKLNEIQLMDEEGVKDSMKIVLTPINYIRGAMVHIKYKFISKDPTSGPSFSGEEKEDMSSGMTPGMSFPLLNQENVQSIGDLPPGWYLVCAEVTKFHRVLEEECFTTRIFEKAASKGLETGIIVLIVLAMIVLVILAVFMVMSRLRSARQKKKDKEMQDRIQKMAQKERELNERNKPAFHHIYVDPDEPYEERCIM